MAHLKKFISIILVMALALSILPIIPAIAQPSVQPIVWYTFDNVEGTTVKDMSGNNNDGTLYGSAKTGSSGIDGNALILNENNENNGYMQLPSGIFKGVNDFTVATWVNVKSAESYARIFDFGMNSNGGNMFLTPFGGGQLVFAITNSGAGSEQRLTYTQLSTTDEWVHIAITMQGDTVTLYLDGVNVAQKDGFTFTPSSALGEDINNYIGKSFYGADRYFRGSFDDYRIYDSALSQKDLLSLAYPNIQNIVSIDNVTASTDIGIIPELPSYVTVHYEDGTSGSLPVVWDEMTSDMFLSGNDVNVYGFVPATEIKASAVVSINSISLVEDIAAKVSLTNDAATQVGTKGTFTIYNDLETAQDVLLQIALYNEQSVLIGYASSQETIAANTLLNKEIKAIIPDEYIDSTVYAKAFIWGGKNYLTPIANMSDTVYDRSKIGLMLHYDFNETQGIKVVDKSGNGYDGELVGNATRTQGFDDGAIHLAGNKNDYISFPTEAFTGCDDVTISMWIKLSPDIARMYRTFCPALLTVGQTGNYFVLSPNIWDSGRPRCALATNAIEEDVWPGGIVTANQWAKWSNLVITKSGDTASIYLDGILLGTDTIANSFAALAGLGQARIGSSHIFADASIKGEFEDFKIYNRAMSADEIISNIELETAKSYDDLQQLIKTNEQKTEEDIADGYWDSFSSALTAAQSITSDASSNEIAKAYGDLARAADMVRQIKVACVGDSITHGELCTDANMFAQSYPAQLDDLIGDEYDVRNFGVGGSTMIDAPDVLSYRQQLSYTDSLEFSPDIVIIKLGTNDAGTARMAQFEQDARSLIESYINLPSNPKVYIATSAYCYFENAQTDTIQNVVVPIQKKLAEEYGLTLIDINTVTSNMNELFPDNLHPNRQGYGAMANAICASIRSESQISQQVIDLSVKLAEAREYVFNGQRWYTDNSWNTLKQAIAESEILLNDAQMLGDDSIVTLYTQKLDDAINGLTRDEEAAGYIDVQLTDGIFADSRDVGAEYLLSFDCDRLLASLYLWTDKDGPKDVYWGWETDAEGNGIAGHSIGHYMSACVNMYMQTGNEEFKDRIDYMVDMMAKVQDDDGFLGGFKRELLDYVFENPATFPVSAFDLNSVWVPWYSLHKIYAGLLDAYTYLGNEQALDVMIGLADYAKAGTDKLNDEQMQRMLSCEHGGVNESFAQLYEITGEKKYLDLAKRFCHKAIMDPLAEGRDDLTGKHGNTQIPKIIGAAKIYELTGEEYYKNVAENFWKFVVYDRSYANGGNTLSEHFTGLGTEPLADNTTESCNTYNMLKLTEYLYSFDHKSEYIEYYENALYNHILGSQDPNDGHKTYFIDLRMGGNKTYRNDFECCVGSGMENPGRYYKMIYYKDGSDLFVNLFINSELNWSEKGIKLNQQTDFPDKDTSKITITEANNAFASIKVRIPEWVCSDATVSVNGQAITEKPVDGYITITRQWNTGDVIDIKLPMDLNLYVSRESNNVVAFKYGPILLAGEMKNNEVLSLVVDSRDPNEFITRTSEDKAIFELDNILQPGTESMTLKPFYEFIDQRHMVYWNLYTNEEYEAIGGQVGESFNQKLDKISIDKVEPYFQQSEIDHNMQINGTSNSGYYEPANGGWRDAHGISSFSYDVKVDPTKTNYLLSVFWGSDGPFDNYTRQFDILVDGTPLKTDYILNNNKPNELIYEYYEIPAELLEGKDKVTVTYRSNSANTAAGGVFGVRITTEILMPE